MNQNLNSAHNDFMKGLLTLMQACSKWDVTSDELLKYIKEEYDNEGKNVCDTQGSD